MFTIELTESQKDMLEGILMSYLSDLRMEISHTDRKNFRDSLKQREVFIKELLEQLAVTV